MSLLKTLWSLTPIGATANLIKIARGHENREVRETTIGWQIDKTYTEDTTIAPDRPREFYRVVREAKPVPVKVKREVKEAIRAKLARAQP